MTSIRRSDLCSGAMLILCCSLVPIGARFLTSAGHARESVQAGMLLGAAVLASASAGYRAESRPRRIHRGRLLLLAAVGTLASVGYFQVVFNLGAADADWIENSLFTILLVVFGWRLIRRPVSWPKLVSLGLAMIGYVVFVVPHSADREKLITSAICFPIAGALGSAVGFFIMQSLTRDDSAGGMGRFSVLAFRYSAIGLASAGCFLASGPLAGLDWTGFWLAAIVGGVLINGAIYYVLDLGSRKGGMAVGVWMLGVPVATTWWEAVLDLHHTRDPLFYIGAAVIFTSLVLDVLTDKSNSQETQRVDSATADPN